MPVFFDETARIAITAYGAVQRPKELSQFLRMLAGHEPEVIVEIGVYSGGTLYAWKTVAPTVIGIDLLPGGPWPKYNNGCPREEHDATVIIGNSHEEETVAELKEHLDGRPIDVLFIDGDHSYHGVCMDYDMYRPLVRPGGLIAFHDIVSHPYQNCEVDKLWRQIKDDTAIEIIDTVTDAEPWGGIGVLRVKGT